MEGAPIGGFDGLLSSGPRRSAVRYIFQTHGIRSSGVEWTYALIKAIERYGYVEEGGTQYLWHNAPLAHPMLVNGRDAHCDRADGCRFTYFGQYSKRVFFNPRTNTHVIVFAYRWKDDLWTITGHYLKSDIAANSLPFPSTKRSAVNETVKVEMIDDGFSDAVGYLSNLGALEREGMETAVCAMLSDALAIKGPSPGAGCIGRFDAADLRRLSRVEFNFLSHSLGSRMLYDVLSGAVPGTGYVRSASEYDARALVRARTHEIIMAANQMPLLAPSEFSVIRADGPTAGRVTAAGSPPTAFVNLTDDSALPSAVRDQDVLHLTVIAFQDPDDLLGFKASDAVIGDQNPSVTFVDILHRNATQWAFSFVWPPDAHDRELEERHSRQMIMCGAEENPDRTLTARPCPTTPSGN